MRINNNKLVWVITTLFSILCCALCLFLYGMTDTAGGRIVWTGVFFSIPLVGSLLGSYLAERIQRRYFSVIHKNGRVLTLVLAVVVGFAVGAGGQAVYMLSPDQSDGKAAVDIVMLLDGSGSMRDKKESCGKAAESLIKQIGSENRVQVVSFAATVLGNTELVPMNAKGKKSTEKFIRSIDVIGGTNFEAPLTLALETLKDSGSDRTKAVILLSDGAGDLPGSLEQDYINQNVQLYTIRVGSKESESDKTQALIQMAQDTGGFDTLIETDNNDRLNEDDVANAFSAVFAATNGTVMREQMIVHGKMEGIFLLEFLIRMAVFALYAILAGVIYYRSLSKAQVIGNLAAGVVLAVLVTLSGQLGFGSSVLSSLLFCIFIFSAYTTYHCDEVEDYV